MIEDLEKLLENFERNLFTCLFCMICTKIWTIINIHEGAIDLELMYRKLIEIHRFKNHYRLAYELLRIDNNSLDFRLKKVIKWRYVLFL